MSVNIQVPSLRPPRVSILSSAEVIGLEGDRWFGTISFLPLSARDATGVYPVCPVGSVVKDASNQLGEDSVVSYAIYATDSCSTFGSGAIDFLDRAKQKLSVAEPWWIENQLWESDNLATNASFVGSASTTVATNLSPGYAFARLDAAVAESRHDGRGMIHVPPLVFGLLPDRAIRREGNVWLSRLDNIVVPGRGYTGNGPNPGGGANENDETASQSWMFGHAGTILIARSDIFTYPDAENLNRQMNRTVNDIWVTAERVVAVIPTIPFDAESLFAASVDTTE